MLTVKTTNELFNLFQALDSQDTLDRKLFLLGQWARVLGVEEIRVLIPGFHQEETCPEDFEFSPDCPVAITEGSSAPPFMRRQPEWYRGGLYYPLPSHKGESLGVILLKTESPMGLLVDHGPELGLLASKIRDQLLLYKLGDRGDRAPLAHEKSTVELAMQGTFYDASHRHILESLNLPLYLSHLSGEFIFVNKPFLLQFGFVSVEEMNSSRAVFFDPMERSEQTRALAKSGFTNGYHLTVQSRMGNMMTVRDYAAIKDGYILGILFDVTEYVNLNREMKEALEIQELLNDQIISSALILQKTQTTSIRALARLAEYRDQETGGHLQRICEYTGILAEEVYKRQPYDFKITEQYVNDIILSSMLHDIGKVAVPDSILRKKNNLSPEEWETMKKHTAWGWQILNQADKELGEQSFLTLASQIALNHHEKWDGTGYPNGMKGEKIPLSARIETIADVYDALTSVRPYKHAWSHEEAMDEIVSLKGIQFDPLLVDILLEVADKFVIVKSKFAGETS